MQHGYVKRLSRDLQILYIDDRASDRLDFLQGFCNTRPVSSLEEAQKSFLHMREGYATPIDLLLCDVDMSENHPNDHHREYLSNIVWGVNPASDLRLYGPLLALPFMGFASPWCQFIPFSRYWDEQEVYQNGDVLVAVSLILAANRGSTVPLDELYRKLTNSRADDRELVDTHIGDDTFEIQPIPALGPWLDIKVAIEDGLREMRMWIERGARAGEVQLIGVNLARNNLAEWIDLNNSNKWNDTSAPFMLNGEPIAIELSHAQVRFGLDSIAVSSLCADLINFRVPKSEADCGAIFKLLSKWEDLPNTVPKSSQTVYKEALSLLGNRSPGYNECVRKGPKKRIEENIRTKGNNYYAAVARVAILLAFTRAWYFHKCYGYNDIEAIAFEYLGFEKSGMNKLGDMLCPSRNNVGTGLRSPFKQDYKSANDAYMLNSDTPALLTSSDMFYCNLFVTSDDIYRVSDEAEDGWRRWDESDFPQWMTTRAPG